MATVAYRAIRGRRKFMRHREVRHKLHTFIADVVMPKYKADFDKIVSDWKNRPEFTIVNVLTLDAIKLDLIVGGDTKSVFIWKFNTGGTRSHPITARNFPTLRFKTGYVPKTTPPPSRSYGGPGKATGKYVFPITVQHPGTKGREWEKFVREKNKRWFSRTMENAWRRIIRSL